LNKGIQTISFQNVILAFQLTKDWYLKAPENIKPMIMANEEKCQATKSNIK